jgi:outer membrane lipoprotein-sorting protein
MGYIRGDFFIMTSVCESAENMNWYLLRKYLTPMIGGMVFLPLFLSFSFAQTAGTAHPESVLALIRKNYSPENSLSTQFSLTIFWSVRENQEKKKGSIVLAAGNRFRVEADRETWVSDGTTFWDYTPASQQVVIRRLADVGPSSYPSQIFTRYLTAFHFQEQDRRNGVVRLSGKNDSADAAYASIQLWAQEQSGRIDRCVLTDQSGNTFTYVFSDTRFGRNFSRETFEFAIPKSARIVDMRN